MDNNATKTFALELLHADTEDQVIDALKRAGYWDDPLVWRDYGDFEGNYATIGNQQSRPEAALVEKIINSVDARLMNACHKEGIDPTSNKAPSTIPEAVGEFFEGTGGNLGNWTSSARRAEAENITLAATGPRRNTSISIADRGEGQTPARIPKTFMSISRDNKLRIPFVQGKFNMGGTGALKFCGEHRFQLLITKRNPALLSEDEKNVSGNAFWSVTVTRRFPPKKGAGQVRNSVFRYLAPINAKDEGHGEVLSFSADKLPLMPEHNKPYSREVHYGSVLKLFNYDMKGFQSHTLMPDGLLYRLEALLPGIALPVNIHECRDFEGSEKGSFVTPLAGLTVRLEGGKSGNLEDGFPDNVPFKVRGDNFVAKIYAFREGRKGGRQKGRASTYTRDEGVIFSVNGQTHGFLPKTIFKRKKVKLGRLVDSLLVTVECSEISDNARENLFMNSRDRLSDHKLRKEIENELEEILAQHPKLKHLANARREADIGERLADSKPLEDVLGTLIKTSPTLASLFRMGPRLGNPFNRQAGSEHRGNDGSGRGGNGGSGPGEDEFSGRKHPTFFRHENKKYGDVLDRKCEHGRRCRIKFETDVENEYFKRDDNPGWYEVEVIESDDRKYDGLNLQTSLLPHNGLANWSILIPEDVEIGETLTLKLTVADDTLVDPFINVATLHVQPRSTRNQTKQGDRRSSSSGGGGNKPIGITLPDVVEVEQKEWTQHGLDERSACKITQENDGSYTFYMNVDNRFILHEMKHGKEDPSLIKAKFKYGNVLVGLALLQEDRKSDQSESVTDNNREHATVEERVEQTTRALGPFLIPMIDYLGSMNPEDLGSMATSGGPE